MTNTPAQLDLFENIEELVYLRHELKSLRILCDDTLRSIFSRHNELSKYYLSLRLENELLQQRLKSLEKCVGCPSFDDEDIDRIGTG